MIAVTSETERKQSLNLSSAQINGRQSPNKSSSSDTNNTDSANQLTSANSSSSNETVIAPPGEQQQQPPPPSPSSSPNNKRQATLVNGTTNEPLNASEEPAGRPRSRTLKSLFIQFAGQHLNLFQNHSNSNNNWAPTKQRASNGKRTSNQPVEAHEYDLDGQEAVECSNSKPVSNLNNNFLVSFAQKCFHLNFSSSSSSAAAESAASITSRNCHSCPVTPIKRQHDPWSVEAANEEGQTKPSGLPDDGSSGDKKADALGKRSFFAAHEANQGVSKRPQVRFVVDLSLRQNEEQPGADRDDAEADRNSKYPDRTSESGRGASGRRGGYFMINKHNSKSKQARVKLNDCGVQTTAAKSLLENQGEFIEDDEERAKLVELLFKLPEANNDGDDRTTTARYNCGGGEPDAATHQQHNRRQPMNSGQFREYGYRLIDYICNYLDTIRQRRLTPINIEPGYLKSLIKPSAPEQGEPFSQIMHDFENHIMCGITHWQHPHFHAYFPAGNAYPSILADMLSDALGCVGFSWAASPAYTELEIIMLDWMGKMIGLPDEFLCLASSPSSASGAGGASAATGAGADGPNPTSSSSSSRGGGVIQGSASECVLVSMLAARHWAMDKLRKKYPGVQDGMLLSKLIGYCSKEAHSCVEKAAMIGFIRMRALETDEKNALRGDTLRRAIELDIAQGLEPFIVCATLGTTSCVSFDNLRELGEVCRDNDNLWLHVDAAYAGSALICPEFKYLIDGIELVTSINMNPNKWMLINFDCSLMWVKDRFKLTRAFVVDPLYLQHSFSDQAIDYRHWGIPLSRRFRALKLWFVIRNYGVEGLREYIRNHVRLAKLFESLIREDKRFMITNEVTLGLVCFRLIGSNALNQRLLSMLNASGKLHMVPASLNGRYIIRFCVCDQNAKAEDIHYAYECISEMASELFELIKAGKERIRAISQQNTIDVSNISLHTQQSASADRLNGNQEPGAIVGAGDGVDQQVAAAANKPGSLLLGRNSIRRNERDTAETNQRDEEPAARSPLGGVRNPRLMKQASIRAADHARPISGLSNAEARDLEDLEQEVPIDTLAAIDDYDLDDELEEELLEELQEDQELLAGGDNAPLGAGGAGEPQVVDEQQQREQQLRSIMSDPISPIQSGRLSRASASVRSSSTRAATGAKGSAGGEDADEAADELVKLVNKRNRMSLRYKREFFVRVVSDPRVYRASISGDINAHTSSNSSLASQPPIIGSQHQQSTTDGSGSKPPPLQQRQQQQE